MGLFDDIRIAAPHNEALDPRVRDATFQTKDFECMMQQYEINEQGRIIEHRSHLEALPDEECEYYGSPEWERGGIYRLIGSMRSVSDGSVELAHHGDIYFYTSIGDRNNGDYEWFEYKARFTDGTLQWIRPIFTSGMSVKGVLPEDDSVITETRYVENDDGTITVRTEIDLGDA